MWRNVEVVIMLETGKVKRDEEYDLVELVRRLVSAGERESKLVMEVVTGVKLLMSIASDEHKIFVSISSAMEEKVLCILGEVFQDAAVKC
jgi:hypothetical protein